MQQFLQFVINHWFLWSVLSIFVALLIYHEINANAGGGRKISPQDAVQLMNREKAVLIDLRDQTNFENGHVTGAINIPLKHLSEKNDKMQKYKKRPIILMCIQGQHAAKACAQLVKQGYEKVYFIGGGIGAWRSASLPLIKSTGN
jgi:rhodanese-related sulfurtransferase